MSETTTKRLQLIGTIGETITVDSAPTLDSTNAVSSGGVYTELTAIQEDITTINDNMVTKTYVDTQVELKQDKIIGTAGQFVVIGSDGNVTTKTILNAEEASF